MVSRVATYAMDINKLTDDEVLQVISQDWQRNYKSQMTKTDALHILKILNFPQLDMISSSKDPVFIQQRKEAIEKMIFDATKLTMANISS